MSSMKSLVKLLGRMLLGGAIVGALSSCKSSSGNTIDAGPDAPSGCIASDGVAMIAENHIHSPHKLVVTSADVAAGVEKTYDIMGTAGHTHMVTITAADFAMLKAGGTIMETSTVDLCHSHVITVSCG